MAWPDHVERACLDLPEGSTVAQAVAAAALPGSAQAEGHAVHGIVVDAGQRLVEGDRVELLRPLLIDPKQARRRRARAGAG